jgi:RNA polymerase sigma-70 factor (ECF subfamily)
MDGRVDASARNRQDLSDAALLAAIASRDGAAFSVFYRRHVPMVLAYLLRETRDREAAADLAAEVFAAILLSADRYAEQHESAAPWVIAIARNKLLMSLRHGRVEAQARRRLGFEAVTLEDDDLDRLERIAAVGGGHLVEWLEILPQNERVAVRSGVLDERSYGELAGELHCSEMVVRKRVRRGLARMRNQLGETGPPTPQT